MSDQKEVPVSEAVVHSSSSSSNFSSPKETFNSASNAKQNWFEKLYQNNKHKEVEEKLADETLKLVQKLDGKVPDFTPEQEKKLFRKLLFTIVPLVFMVNATLFIDKNAVGYSSLLGVFPDMNIDKAKYNNIQTFFYVGYFVGQVPSHLAFQKYPVSKYVTVITASWALISFCTLASKSYAGMSVLRLILGMVESGVTPCIEHTLSMFFTPEEQAFINPVFWISCLGIDVPTGFIAYGLQFTTKWRPWKWYWLMIGILSTLVSIVCFFFYPDNPAQSVIFTPEERLHIIKRVKKASKSSIEQKTFKAYQFVECIKDPISWLFFLFCLMNMLENSTTYQASIIYSSLGFSNLTTTLLMVVQNGFSTCCALVGATTLYLFRKQSCIVAVCYLIPACVGAIIAISIDYDNKPMLAGIFMTRTNGTAYIISFALCQSTAAGYTKRLTRTAMFMIAYSIGNVISPQMWRPYMAPRYTVPWVIQIVFSWGLAPITLLVIRFILKRRNDQRLKLMEEDPLDERLDYGYVDIKDEEGQVVREKVDVSMLDLTDLENVRFIYPL
ncbi:hypothetical protein CANINC_004941 [Pichia inconspicua]|uniref:Major facilitator superfamily (MFS) profile domain-containing protein n=1 Tax=Pichia inconspicua TaxID=52247 RepID=A0A4T0WUR3_9ASCO|nr:hypothetical protein CANINC_004941 [[Candida] inconspicua]